MSRKLVAYFSATGTTAKVAQNLAEAIGADLYEIEPAVPYTAADLDWTDKKSRSSLEMSDKSQRPALKKKTLDLAQYDTVFVGFPIWWYVAPTIVNAFLEQHDWHGKTLVPFATSGSSGMGETNAELAPSCKGAALKEGKRFARNASAAELEKWAQQF